MARVSDTEDYYSQLFGGTEAGGITGGGTYFDNGTGGGNFNYTDPPDRSNTPPTPANGASFTDAPGGTAPSGAGGRTFTQGAPTVSWEDQIRQYQQANPNNVNIDAIANSLGVSRYMYGSTPSNNELMVNGGPYKVISEPTNSWYAAGTNDSGPQFSGYTAGSQSQQGFADPAYQQLLDLANRRINQLQQPQSNPQMEAYFASLMQEKELAKQRAQTFADQLTGRIGQLQQPLLSDADSARIRAQYQNGTQAERDRALASNRERLAIRGFDPRTSGLLEGTNRATNAAYDARTGNIDATLANQAISQDEQRRNQATTLQQLAYQALNGGDLTSLQQQATASDLERQQYDQQQARERELLTTAGIPVELSNTGLQNALATLGSGGNSSSALQSLFGALGLAQQQQSIDSANTASLFGGAGGLLASILPYILPKK